MVKRNHLMYFGFGVNSDSVLISQKNQMIRFLQCNIHIIIHHAINNLLSETEIRVKMDKCFDLFSRSKDHLLQNYLNDINDLVF